jgi:hypothetical protein
MPNLPPERPKVWKSYLLGIIIVPAGIILALVQASKAHKLGFSRARYLSAVGVLAVAWIGLTGIIIGTRGGAASYQAPAAAPAASAPAAAPSTAVPTPTPTPTGPAVVQLGTAAPITENGSDAATVTVSDYHASTSPVDQYSEGPANGYFVTFTATDVANSSFTSGFTASPDDFYALVNGQHYGITDGNALEGLSDASSELSFTNLAASETASGKLSFDVPSAHGLIVYAPNLNGQPVVEWKY